MRIWPYYKEDYNHHYGAIRYRGKKVIDVGADIGSTADFFLRRGATEVIAVEGNKKLYAELVKNARKIPEIKPVFLYIKTSGHFEQLIRKHRPDVLQSDCEGCEVHLFKVPDEVFRMVPEYMVETHGDKVHKYMIRKCKACRYDVVKVILWHAHTRIVYAKRRD